MKQPTPRKTSKQKPVFSYVVKGNASTIILSQQETGFVLSIKMEQLEDTLRITKFTLMHNTQLAHLSLELNDAALLEIIVKALTILLTCAEHHAAKEIFFILSQKDATHLASFEGFFDKVESLTTREGNKNSFTIYNTRESWEFLKEKVETIKIRIKQELWQLQRENHYIKNFLQNHQRGTLLPLLTLQNEEVNNFMGNVIHFPQRKR